MERIDINTKHRNELVDITKQIESVLEESRFKDGICYVFVPHTTAGMTINENADPSVCRDILNELGKIVSENRDYAHAEGNSDSHIKASLIGSSVTVFVKDGKLVLGTWQGVYFAEFDGPRNRQVWIKTVEE